MYYYTFTPKFDLFDNDLYLIDGSISLNDHIFYYGFILLILVIWMVISIIYKRNSFILKDLNKGSLIEILWTLFPSIILILIALPLFKLSVYIGDNVNNYINTLEGLMILRSYNSLSTSSTVSPSALPSGLPSRCKSSNGNNNELNPNFISGLADADGCFYIKTGQSVQLMFTIVAYNSPENYKMFEDIIKFLGVGKIYYSDNIEKGGKESSRYIRLMVTSIKDCLIIHQFFLKYPLYTYKHFNFLLWSEALHLILKGEHLLSSGKERLLLIKSILNKGLNENTSLVLKSLNLSHLLANYILFKDNIIIDPHWLAGFIEGDGSFSCALSKNVVKSTFGVTQNKIDSHLITLIQGYFNGIGNCTEYKGALHYKVSNKIDIFNHIIPFFIMYPLRGEKYYNFLNFYEIYKIIINLDSTPITFHKLDDEKITKIQYLINNSNSFYRKDNNPSNK